MSEADDAALVAYLQSVPRQVKAEVSGGSHDHEDLTPLERVSYDTGSTPIVEA